MFGWNRLSYVPQCERFDHDHYTGLTAWYKCLTASKILWFCLLMNQIKCNLKWCIDYCNLAPFQRRIRIQSWPLLSNLDQKFSWSPLQLFFFFLKNFGTRKHCVSCLLSTHTDDAALHPFQLFWTLYPKLRLNSHCTVWDVKICTAEIVQRNPEAIQYNQCNGMQ